MSHVQEQTLRLSAALLDGPWNRASMIERTVPLVKGNRKLLLRVIRATLKKFPQHRPRRRLLMEFLSQAFRPKEDFEENGDEIELQIDEYLQPTVFSCQSDSFAELEAPRWETVRDLAEWLDIDDARLQWFADQKGDAASPIDGPLG